MEIVNWLKSLFLDYGAINVIIMLLVIVITNLIKKPIINKADTLVNFAKEKGIDMDKSVITSNIIYIPIGVAIILYFIYNIIITGFNFAQIDFAALIATSITYGMLSMSIYEIGKAKIKSFLSKDKYKKVKEELAKQEATNVASMSVEAETTENVESVEDAEDLIIKEGE